MPLMWISERLTERSRSLVKPKIHDVVVLHHVSLEFQALFAGAFGLRLTAGFNQIRKADDLRADEAFLNVRMNGAGGFPGGYSGANRPGAIFFAADGQKTDVTALLKRAHQQSIGTRQIGFL